MTEKRLQMQRVNSVVIQLQSYHKFTINTFLINKAHCLAQCSCFV